MSYYINVNNYGGKTIQDIIDSLNPGSGSSETIGYKDSSGVDLGNQLLKKQKTSNGSFNNTNYLHNNVDIRNIFNQYVGI
jgi:hypothetical protein